MCTWRAGREISTAHPLEWGVSAWVEGRQGHRSVSDGPRSRSPSSAPATSVGPRWQRWCSGRWRPSRRSPTARGSVTACWSRAPGRPHGTQACRWIPAHVPCSRHGAIPTTVTSRGPSRPHGWKRPIWWSAWTVAIARRSPVWRAGRRGTIATRTDLSSCAPSTAVREVRSTCRIPTTATRSTSRPVSTWSRRGAEVSPRTL